MRPTGRRRQVKTFRQPTVTLNRRRGSHERAVSTTTLDEMGDLLVAPPSRRAPPRRSISASDLRNLFTGGRTTSAWVQNDDGASMGASERSVVLGRDDKGTPRAGARSSSVHMWNNLKHVEERSKGVRSPSADSERSSPEGLEGKAARANSSRRQSSERDAPRALLRRTSSMLEARRAAGAFLGLIGRTLNGSGTAETTTAPLADANDVLGNVSARRRARLVRAQQQRASVFSSSALSEAAQYAATHVAREESESLGAAHAGETGAAAPQLRLSIDTDGNYEHNLGDASFSDRNERKWGRLKRRLSLGVEDFARNVQRGGELQVGMLARGGLVNVSTSRGLSGEESLSRRQRERLRKTKLKKKEQDLQTARDEELEKRLGFKPKTFTLCIRIENESTENLGLELRQRKRGGIMVAPSLFSAVKRTKTGQKLPTTVIGAAGDVVVVAVHEGLLRAQHGQTCVPPATLQPAATRLRACTM